MTTTRILAAVDRFPEDDAVLERGQEIAARHGVPLTVVHVADLPDNVAAPALIHTIRAQTERAARNRITSALRRQGMDPEGIEIRIETGSPAQRLVAICEALDPSLVVMRAHHKPWILAKLLGSTTEKVIASGLAPVLVVRQDSGKPHGRVLLAIEGPDAAPAVLARVSALLPDAAYHMVQAVELARPIEEAMLRLGLTRTELAAHHDVLAQEAATRLRTLSAELGPRVTWQVLRGEPAEELVRATQDDDVGLIVLGPHRAGLIRRALMGSVTRRVLRDAASDVLVIPPLAPAIQAGAAPRDDTETGRGADPHHFTS